VNRLAQRFLEPFLSNRVAAGLLLLTFVVAFGTVGYVLVEGWSFGDAFFMTVTTITTVGYREVRELDTAGRVLTMILILTGVGAAFYTLTAMVAAIIEGDLRQVFGARRMRTAIERLRDHHIICGYGRVGQEIGRELGERKTPFVIVDSDPEVVQRVLEERLFVIEGNATSDGTLIAAGIQRCRALYAASDSDATNVYITLTAKSLNPNAFVIARVSTPTVETKLRQAGADRIISPYSISGRRMALAGLQPIITDFIDLLPADSQEDRVLAEVFIDQASGLVGRELGDALKDCDDVVALAVRDAAGELNIGPPRSRPLAEGETLVVAGDEDDLRRLRAAR
jgi:voltage-gated potassium channel